MSKAARPSRAALNNSYKFSPDEQSLPLLSLFIRKLAKNMAYLDQRVNFCMAHMYVMIRLQITIVHVRRRWLAIESKFEVDVVILKQVEYLRLAWPVALSEQVVQVTEGFAIAI